MIIQKSKSRLITIIIHVLIWVVFGLVYFFQPLTWDIAVPYQFFIKNGILLTLVIIAYYANTIYLVPKFLLKNSFGGYFIIVLVFIICIVFLSTYNGYLDRWLNLPKLMDAAFHRHRAPKHHRVRTIDWDLAIIAIMALTLGIGTSITTIQKWQYDKQRHQEMEQDKISSELSFLKAQINPHFFFNTLNNIYALTLVNAETSRKAIHQLSRMMRYVLYDTQNSTTQLSQEIAFIKDYISLMQLRLTEAVKIEFTSPQTLNDIAIAPMLFLPFIENAFKHGVSTTKESFIKIEVEQQGNSLSLKVVNSIIKEQSSNLEDASGIGLNNTRRRLDLLYAGNYELLIDENLVDEIYSINLTIKIS